MADLSFLKILDKPIAVLGLGISGRAVAQACVDAGVPFHAWDDNAETRARYENEFPIKNFSDALKDYAFLVPSAGMKPDHSILAKAAEQKISIQSDVDLLLQSAPRANVIAITGTNGKSTTTALIGHVLKEAAYNVQVGGNIGKAACSLLPLDSDGWYVLEMSSYMLEITANPIADVAVLLNVTPDHLDWHETFENYKAAKEKIFRQREGRPPQKRVYGLSMPHHESVLGLPDFSQQPYLKGAHNQENMVAAFAVCRAIGMDRDTIEKHIMSFEGLAHRQKQVATYQQIEFINDSKATNADATSKALASFDNIYWIVGGMPKSDGIDGLDVFYPKIKSAYLIGQASQEFARKLEGHVSYQECGTIAAATAQAFKDALQSSKPAVILLSPACASFDQYKNFEQRGDDFAAQVQRVLQEAQS
jgi:UDP-N-acetylmuramoylalanine--D-glutamate ligase